MEEQRKNTLIYVLSKDGKPLMPIKKPAKVRRWLRDGKAKVIRKCPFTIKLLFETKGECLQNVTLGVDTGSKHIGVACVSNNKVLYQSQVELRDGWITEKCIVKIEDTKRHVTENQDF